MWLRLQSPLRGSTAYTAGRKGQGRGKLLTSRQPEGEKGEDLEGGNYTFPGPALSDGFLSPDSPPNKSATVSA